MIEINKSLSTTNPKKKKGWEVPNIKKKTATIYSNLHMEQKKSKKIPQKQHSSCMQTLSGYNCLPIKQSKEEREIFEFCSNRSSELHLFPYKQRIFPNIVIRDSRVLYILQDPKNYQAWTVAKYYYLSSSF